MKQGINMSDGDLITKKNILCIYFNVEFLISYLHRELNIIYGFLGHCYKIIV